MHNKCSIYSLLPLISHPPLPARRPWGPHRKRKEDRWNCPFYGNLLLLEFTLLHYKVNPSSSCQSERKFSWDCVTRTLVFTVTAKKILHVNKRAWKVLDCGLHAGCCVSSGMTLWGWMCACFWTHSVTGADSWQRGSGALAVWGSSWPTDQFSLVWTLVRFGVQNYLKSLWNTVLWAGKMNKHVRGTSIFAPLMGCFCKCVSLCVYASNGGFNLISSWRICECSAGLEGTGICIFWVNMK